MLTSSFNILNSVYLGIKPMKKMNRNLIEEEDSSELLENFIAVHRQEGENRSSEI